jgi:hypothetical protein
MHFAGSFFQRVNASLGEVGDNTAIEGFKYPISGPAGSQDIALNRSTFETCVGKQSLYMALFDALSENGSYSLDPNYRPPALVYNCDSKCVSGGHAPPAGTQGLCPDATWDALSVPAGGASSGPPRT